MPTTLTEPEKQQARRQRAEELLRNAIQNEDHVARIEAQATAGLGVTAPPELVKRRDDQIAMAGAMVRAAGLTDAEVATIRASYFHGDEQQGGKGVLWSYARTAFLAAEDAKAAVGTEMEAEAKKSAESWVVALAAVEALAAGAPSA